MGFRSWTNPAWGQSLLVVEAYIPDWASGDWADWSIGRRIFVPIAYGLFFLRNEMLSFDRPAHIAQMELFTHGIYPVGHPFVNGLHPFFGWEDVSRVEFSFTRRKLSLTLRFRASDQPLSIKLGGLQAAGLAATLATHDRAMGSPLGQALERYAGMRQSGMTKGSGSAGT